MGNKILTWIIIILLFAIIGLLVFREHKSHVANTQEAEIEMLNIQNDSLSTLNGKLQLTIDSLMRLSRKVDSVIIETNKVYEKKLVNITNQPFSTDAKFWTKYLSEDSSRFIISNNATAVKTN